MSDEKLNESGNKKPSWEKIAKGLENWGWSTEELHDNRVIIFRGRQRIIARKIPSANKWKVEYYSGNVMDDMTGINDEEWAKIEFSEMGIIK